jgi:hypothetical protein
MLLAIVGSRDFPDLWRVNDYISLLPSDTTIVSGGARGVDRTAADAASQYGLPCIEYLAQWERDGKPAGYKRNQRIVDNCDQLVAFWDGKSPGTRHSIDLARKAGKLKDVFYPDPNDEAETPDAPVHKSLL